MSLGLTKPGMRSANLTGKLHPKTGEPLQPIGYLKNGTAVWPVLGASSDDPDDPEFVGGGGPDPDDDDDEDEDDEEEKPRKRPAKKSTKAKSKDEDEDDEDDEDDEEELKYKSARQAKRYRLRLRAEETKNAELNARLKALEDRDKDPDEVVSRELTDARTQVQSLTEITRVMQAQLAFFKTTVPGVVWADPSDVFAVAERSGLFDDAIDEDGTVDTRELRRGLKELAKRKPHLVKKIEDDPKAGGRKSKDEDDEDDEEDDDEPSTRRSAGPMNGNRKGKGKAEPTRQALAKRFPVLGRM
jgi:hypothetical protein